MENCVAHLEILQYALTSPASFHFFPRATANFQDFLDIWEIY